MNFFLARLMIKLLTICVPTFKRPVTLRRCIESVVAQIDKYALSDYVDVYVTNDASPDDTISVLDDYDFLGYFKSVTREQNLGMNVNIKSMLIEVSNKSDYQLIITDDDYLQPNVLSEIVDFLRAQQDDHKSVPAIWTPRYSYLEDGSLHCVVCNAFADSCMVKPSVANTGRYMNNGFVLSGLILRAESIDYDFWEKYTENAYFPMIFFGDLLFRKGAYYWNNNIVHHTVLNECHWARWGKNDFVIKMRLFADYVNSFGVMARNVGENTKLIPFYYASFSSIYSQIISTLNADIRRSNEPLIFDAIQELKTQGVFEFDFKLRLFMLSALFLAAILSSLKSIAHFLLLIFSRRQSKKDHHRKGSIEHWGRLLSATTVLKMILS